MTNEDRIQLWKQKRDGDKSARSSGGPAGAAAEADPGDVKGQVDIPTARREELDREQSRQRDIVEALLPGADAVRRERESMRLRRRLTTNKVSRKILLFVGVPTCVAAFYATFLSPPAYQVRSSLAVMSVGEAEVPTAAKILGGGGASNADAYRVREYLLSREAMDQLDREHGFLDHFRKATLDPFSRPLTLPALGLDDEDFYRRKISVTVDAREGLIRIKVDALTPEASKTFAEALIRMAQLRTAAMASGLNDGHIAALQVELSEAEAAAQAGAARVAAVQRQRADLDPAQTAASGYRLIGELEMRLAESQRERSSLLDGGLTESPLLPRIDARIAELRDQIAQQRGRLVGGAGDRTVQNATVDLELASSRKRIAEMTLESLQRTFEQARVRALEQRSHLVVVAAPVSAYSLGPWRVTYLATLTAVFAALFGGAVFVVAGMRRFQRSR